MARRNDLKFSAYADDFYFSGDEIGPKFRSIVVNMLSKWGFKAHEFGTPKNRLMVQGKDQVIVTGLRLTQEGEIRLPRKVYGEGTRLIKQLKSAPYPTEEVWLSEVDMETGAPVYGSHLVERDPNSVIGLLKYCYENDRGFRAWAERQLAAPEYSHILGKITGKQEPELLEVPQKKQKPTVTKVRTKVNAKITPSKQDLLPRTEAEEGMPISDFLRVWDLEKILGISRSTIYRKERKGEFPRRVRIGDNSVAWNEVEVRAWLAERPRGMT
jgi:prophage regulatory protein